jgi:hypothetical protein
MYSRGRCVAEVIPNLGVSCIFSVPSGLKIFHDHFLIRHCQLNLQLFVADQLRKRRQIIKESINPDILLNNINYKQGAEAMDF